MQSQRYQIKIYDINNNFVRTIKNDTLLTDITFTKNINGGMGEVTFEVNGKIDIGIFDEQYKVKIFETDPISNQTFLIYGGLINNVENHFQGFFFHRIYCYGYIAFATKHILKSSVGNYVFNYDGTSSNMIKEIIDTLNLEYGNIYSYDSSSIEDDLTDVSVKCDKTTAFDALNIIRQSVKDFYFYIDANGKVFFKKKSNVVEKILVKGRDIYECFQANDLDSIVNHVIIEHILGFEEFEDATSIATWGRRTATLIEKETGSATALKIAEETVERLKNPVKKTRAIIASQYVTGYSKKWTQLEPGMTVSIRNVDDSNITQNIQIVKMSYYKDQIDIEFEETYNNLSKSIAAIAFNVKKKIEKNKQSGGGGGGPGSGGITGYFDSYNDHFLDDTGILINNNIVRENSIIRLKKQFEIGEGNVMQYEILNLDDANIINKSDIQKNNDNYIILNTKIVTNNESNIVEYQSINLDDANIINKSDIQKNNDNYIILNTQIAAATSTLTY